jgi:NAD(P)-dependent dehydrogenase (short-subunit alcohol dehydrogenase family)
LTLETGISMSKPLDGKVIVVTGAASGIGQASSRLFALAGAQLLLADVDTAAGQALESELKAGGARARFVGTDVSVEADVQQMVAAAVVSFGRLHGAFNNAGIGYPDKPLHELALDEWHRTLDVNLTGVFLCMKHEIGAMLQSGGGSIVNTGSVSSVIGLPHSASYGAAKHGVMGLTRTAAVDYSALGIRVNSVLVGATLTPLLKKQLPSAETDQALAEQLSLLHRLAKPEEIGQAALWLLSDASSFVAGTGLTIDGGYTAA